MMNPFAFGKRIEASGGDATISLASSSSATGVAATSKTFTTMAIGSGSHVIVAVAANCASVSTFSSVTVDGVACTLTQQASSTLHVCLAIVANPNPGASVSIVVTRTAGNINGVAIAVYAVGNLSSTTPTGSSTDTTPATNQYDVTVTVPAGGFVVAGAVNGTATAGITWTNATVDITASLNGTRQGSLASKAYAALQTGMTVSSLWTSSTSGSLFAATWR